MSRSSSGAGILIILCALLVSAELYGAPNQTSVADKSVLARTRYRNIQVLKRTPADQLIPMMREYNRALSVGCDFCHQIPVSASGVQSGFELDSKPMKRKARQMIIMMNGLNSHAKTIDRQATCYMCHHGHPEPETQLPADH